MSRCGSFSSIQDCIISCRAISKGIYLPNYCNIFDGASSYTCPSIFTLNNKKNSSLFTCLYSKWTGILKPSSFDKSLPMITMIIIVLHLRLISVWKGFLPLLIVNLTFSLWCLSYVLYLPSISFALYWSPKFLYSLATCWISSFFSVFRMQKYRTMPNWYLMPSAIYSGKTLVHYNSEHKFNNYYCKKTVSYIFINNEFALI